MNLDSIKDFFGNVGSHDLPAGVAGLAGIVFIVLVFRTGKFAGRLFFFLIAMALLAGAWWWHQHK